MDQLRTLGSGIASLLPASAVGAGAGAGAGEASGGSGSSTASAGNAESHVRRDLDRERLDARALRVGGEVAGLLHSVHASASRRLDDADAQSKFTQKSGDNASEASGASGSIDPPRLIVVGLQSSGKTTLLNRLMNVPDLLKTDECLSTQFPWHIQCIRVPAGEPATLELGSFSCGRGGFERQGKLYRIDTPNWRAAVHERMHDEKVRRVGVKGNINDVSVNVRIRSPLVPGICLVDLPGMVFVPQRELGQPDDLRERIIRMYSTYIECPRTLVMLTMAARCDLETDMALATVKQLDKSGERTIAVLTKVDKMDAARQVSRPTIPVEKAAKAHKQAHKQAHRQAHKQSQQQAHKQSQQQGGTILAYLEDRSSESLRISNGYFAVCNRPPSAHAPSTSAAAASAVVPDSDDSDDALASRESAYFAGHSVYGESDTILKRCGIANLRAFVCAWLARHIRSSAPALRADTQRLMKRVSCDLLLLGQGAPSDEPAAMAAVHQRLNWFSQEFTASLRGGVHSNAATSGRRVRKVFEQFGNVCYQLDPFASSECPQQYISEAIEQCEGNRMRLRVPPGVLTHLMVTAPRKPLRLFQAPALRCVDECLAIFSKLGDSLLERPTVARLPQLRSRVSQALRAIYEDARARTVGRIEEELDSQENYVWQYHALDEDVVHSVSGSNSGFGGGGSKKEAPRSPEDNIRSLCSQYFATVRTVMQHNVPHIVMLHLQRAIELAIRDGLFERIVLTAVPHDMTASGDDDVTTGADDEFGMFGMRARTTTSCVELMSEDEDVAVERAELVRVQHTLRKAEQMLAQLC